MTWQFLVLFNDPFTQHNTRTHDYHPCIEILTGTLGNALRYSHGACLLIQSAAAGRDYSSDGHQHSAALEACGSMTSLSWEKQALTQAPPQPPPLLIDAPQMAMFINPTCVCDGNGYSVPEGNSGNLISRNLAAACPECRNRLYTHGHHAIQHRHPARPHQHRQSNSTSSGPRTPSRRVAFLATPSGSEIHRLAWQPPAAVESSPLQIICPEVPSSLRLQLYNYRTFHGWPSSSK